MQPDLVEIGHNYLGRWQHILETYQEVGMFPRATKPGPRPGCSTGPRRPATRAPSPGASWAAALAVSIVGWFAARFYRLNRGLARQLAENRLLQEELRQLATIDPLTRLYNRRHLIDTPSASWCARAAKARPWGWS